MTVLTWEAIKSKAVRFSRRWEDGKDEISEGQNFVREFMAVFGADDIKAVGEFESGVRKDEGFGRLDFFWKSMIAIEMKSRGKDLKKAYNQLKDYVLHLPGDEIPDLLMVCDFAVIKLYRRTTGENWTFKTKKLSENVHRFANIAGYETVRGYEGQIAVNVKAAEKMAKLHDELKLFGYDGQELEVYLVRLLFCLFADDTGIFTPPGIFHNYVENSKIDGSDLSGRLGQLFELLDTDEAEHERQKILSLDLKQFRYIIGGLFESRLRSADFNSSMRKTLIDCAKFDWSKISPAIFGSIFQGVMDKTKRRGLGAHYTSEENILKVISPLFINDLRKEFDRVKTDPAALKIFHNKIASLKFLDPACGCGNFLIITYLELRLLELEIIEMSTQNSRVSNTAESLLKVSMDQFYGIESEDFPCQIAQIGMRLIDNQMNQRLEEYGQYFINMPLTASSAIVQANALRIDWEEVVPKSELSYILGTPPFNGARTMSPAQKLDMQSLFGDLKGGGNLDYAAAWYKKAADYIAGTDIKCAFVSTNSIAQGEQPAILWKPLMSRGIHINFGIPSFKWCNEVKGKAAVFCVIIGFSCQKSENDVNQYLLKAPIVFIESRQHPLCNVPEIGIGNKPIDGGNYLFDAEEKAAFLKIEPLAEKWFRAWIGADEFISNYKRYCLWLGDCSPSELRKMPEVMKRVQAVREYRLASKSTPTRKLADTPRRFHVENMPDARYLVIPETSSEKRKYIPIGFMGPEVLASNKVKIIPNASLYCFGVLTSNVHMAWTRAVCGRLKMDYCYSKDIVYNNFPWPEASPKQKAEIEGLASDVLEARKLFPESSLADLYDQNSMPPELRKVHQLLDKAVMEAYGFKDRDMTETECVGKLMELFKKLVNGLLV
jgi:hypothetical protein